MDEEVAAEPIDDNEAVVAVLVKELQPPRVSLVGGNTHIIAVHAGNAEPIGKLRVVVKNPHVVRVGLAVRLGVLEEHFPALLAVPQHHHLPAVGEALAVGPHGLLAVLQIDELVDDVLFNEHHQAPGCLLLHAEELVAPASHHNRRLLHLSSACIDEGFLQVIVLESEQDHLLLESQRGQF